CLSVSELARKVESPRPYLPIFDGEEMLIAGGYPVRLERFPPHPHLRWRLHRAVQNVSPGPHRSVISDGETHGSAGRESADIGLPVAVGADLLRHGETPRAIADRLAALPLVVGSPGEELVARAHGQRVIASGGDQVGVEVVDAGRKIDTLD